MSYKRLVRFYLLISLFLAIGLFYANPLPDTSPMPNCWDNLYSTAGEPLSLYDIYLAGPGKLKTAILFDQIKTANYWDSNGNIDDLGSLFPRIHSPKIYTRTNMPVSIAYGISRSLEIEVRRAFVTRSRIVSYLPESLLVKEPYWQRYETTNGLGDISLRLRTKILGEQDKPFYVALGIGIKFASSAEFDTTYHLPISPGSTDLFFGIYNAVKLGKFTFPVAVTYSHTGRYLNILPMGEIITYRIGLIIDIHRFVDLNYSLKGYEITEESKTVAVTEGINMSSGIGDKIPEMFPQGISKTTAELGLSVKIPKFRTAISGGIITDLRGRRTYNDDISSIFTMQIGF